MGLCEMIYHETRHFPSEEKEGLARELRLVAVNLLRVITIESTKPQKEFLKALDDTLPIQLDILLLLKLAFRMRFIDERAYQTLEEDLKGLENMINNMKGMHGMAPATKTIHDKVPSTADEPVKRDEKPSVPLPKSEKTAPPPPMERGKPSKNPVPPPREQPRHGRHLKHRPEKPLPRRPMEKKPLPQVINKPPISGSKPLPSKSASSSLPPREFEGTPLFEDDTQQTTTSTPLKSEKKSSEEKSQSSQTETSETKKKQEEAAKNKTQVKGLWSLRRSTMKKESQSGSQSDRSSQDSSKDKGK